MGSTGTIHHTDQRGTPSIPPFNTPIQHTLPINAPIQHTLQTSSCQYTLSSITTSDFWMGPPSLSACLPVCLSLCLPPSLSACLPPSHHACLPPSLSLCLPVPPSLPASLPQETVALPQQGNTCYSFTLWLRKQQGIGSGPGSGSGLRLGSRLGPLVCASCQRSATKSNDAAATGTATTSWIRDR